MAQTPLRSKRVIGPGHASASTRKHVSALGIAFGTVHVHVPFLFF
jgi:hypothetical protein